MEKRNLSVWFFLGFVAGFFALAWVATTEDEPPTEEPLGEEARPWIIPNL